MSNLNGSLNTSGQGAVLTAVKTLQALFNQASSSDLILIVNGTKFFCHRAVLVPSSDYVERFLLWSSSNSNSKPSKNGSKPCIKIDLPDFDVPEPFKGQQAHNTVALFEKFLKVVYGLSDLDRCCHSEVFVMAQIADYLVCDTVTKLCDDILCTISFTTENVLDVTLFCQKYPLVNTFQSVKKYIAMHIFQLRDNPKLYELHKGIFADIMKFPSSSKYWQFFTVYCYVTGQILVENTVRFNLDIKDDKLRELFRRVVLGISLHWNRSDLNYIVKTINRRSDDNLFGGSGRDQAFLYKIFNECYYRLDHPTRKTSP